MMKRRLISTRCQKECEEIRLNGHADSHSDYSARVVRNFDIVVIDDFDLHIFQFKKRYCDFWQISMF